MTNFQLLIGAITRSGAGTLIIILRKLKIGNGYIFNSAEWLMLGTVPLIPASSMVVDNTSKTLFIAAYVSIIVVWGIFSVVNKKIKIDKINYKMTVEQKVKQARGWIIGISVIMIGFEILTFWKMIN